MRMEEGKKKAKAVLVGCNYPNTRNELHGCINDVHAMRDLLVGRFGFDPTEMEIITDEPGSIFLPTGANIKRALNEMVISAEPGDVLFFHYSGHGTRIPAVRPHHGSSRDEAIVPCDFNLITDVDFRHLVNRLPPGVSFTMISDSCHSGGLIDKEKEQIGPSTVPVPSNSHFQRTIPFQTIVEHLTSLSGIESNHIGDHLSGLFGAEASPKFLATTTLRHLEQPLAPDDSILLSGCQADETSADVCSEEDDNGDRSQAYGAFSNSLQMVLKENEGPLSNRELVMRAREVLNKQNMSQHPCLYCSDHNADAPFLSQKVRPAPDLIEKLGL